MENNTPTTPSAVPQPAPTVNPAPVQPLAPTEPEVIQVGQSKGGNKMMLVGLVVVILIVIAAGGGYYYYTNQIAAQPASQAPTPVQANNLNTLGNEAQSVSIASPEADFNEVDQDLQKL